MRITAPHLAASVLLLAVSPEDCEIPDVPGHDDDGADDGHDDGSTDEEPDTEASFYEVENLVGHRTGLAPNTDPNLINPWGLAFGDETFFWVANQGTSTATLYDGEGNIMSDLVGGPIDLPRLSTGPDHNECAPAEGPGGPTGEVYYGGEGFEVEDGAASRFMFATLEGTLIGWSPESSNPRVGVIMVDNSHTGSVYTGLAIAEGFTSHDENMGDDTPPVLMDRLFVADFAGGEVEVYDQDLNPVVLGPNAFVDSGLPAGYSPFGMQVIEDTIYVTYALVDTMTGEAARGTGNGVVTAYDLDGNFLARIGTDGLLDAPWGITVAAEEFGEFGGALLVGNFGNGRITAFDAMTYEVLGQLESAENTPISIEGLWGIAFGNDMNAGDSDDLYFTAGIEDELGGLFGEIGVEDDPAEGDDHGDDGDDHDDDGDDHDDDGDDHDDDGDDHDDDGKDDHGDDGKDDHGDDGEDDHGDDGEDDHGDDDHDSDGDDHDDDGDHDED